MEKGMSKAGGGMNGVVWNVAGQACVPILPSGGAFVRHTAFPAGALPPPPDAV